MKSTQTPQTRAPRSPLRVFIDRMIHNRIAITGGVILFILYTLALLGSFIGPYDPILSNTESPDHPPAKIRFVDRDGNFHIRPFIYRMELENILKRTYVEDENTRYPVRFFVKGEPYRLWWLFDCETHLFGIEEGVSELTNEPVVANNDNPPPYLYLIGSDRLGRDVFSRLLSGAKISLSIGLIGIIITMTLGLFVGGMSGYFGGIIDTLLMRFVELLMSIPGLYLILALRTALSESNPTLSLLFGVQDGDPLHSGQIYVLIVIILGLVGWGGTARVIRGMVIALRKLDYISAAQSLGASNLRIITKHLLPNTMTYVIIAATLSIPGYILGEVALSFLNVGISEPHASWGNMLQEAHKSLSFVNFPWLLTPGVLIFITVFAFNFLGDGIRDALDPKHLE
jgi:peptide/nickel transport system permease protein